MHRNGVVGGIAHRVRLIVADHQRGFGAQFAQHQLGQAMVAIVERADVPGSRYARVDRREAVQRNEDRRSSLLRAPVERLGDGVVIRRKDALLAFECGLLRETLIAGNRRRLADRRDRACGRQRPVTVDHEPRIALRDQTRAERVRHRFGDAGDADVVGDVAAAFVLVDAEIAQRARNPATVVIAGEKER